MRALFFATKIAVIFSLLSVSGYAGDLYVNANSGNDTTGDGSNAKAAFRTILKAITACRGGDVIYIEGSQGIKYYEHVIIPEGKNGLQLVGRNNPEINGSKFKKADEKNAAIEINSDFITVKDISVRDFLSGKYPEMPSGGGIAVYCPSRTTLEFENVTIENCNYGIVFYGSQNCAINDCRFSRMKKFGKNELDGGTGVLFWTKGEYLQANVIGVEKPAFFSDCEGFGIYLGAKDTTVFADFTKIVSNVFKNNGIAIGISDADGIINIEKNYFENNQTAMKFFKKALDTYVTLNTVSATVPAIAIAGDANIDGFYLADIWLKNKNEFPAVSCAALGKDGDVLTINGIKAVFTSPEGASKSGIDAGTLKSKKDLK